MRSPIAIGGSVPRGNRARPELTTRWINRFAPWSLEQVVSRVVDRPDLAVLLGVVVTLMAVPVLEYWPRGSLSRTAPLVFLIPVLLASTLGGWWSGACVTAIAVAVWDWSFVPPPQSLGIASANDLVTLAVYLGVAALVGRLSTAIRRRAAAALQHEAELAAVLDVTRAVASTLDSATVLGLVLEQVQGVLDCTSAALLLQEGDCVCIADYRGPSPPEQVVGRVWQVSEMTMYQELLRRRTPIIVPDLREESADVELLQGSSKSNVLGDPDERSWLWVPLLLKDQVIGVLSLSHQRPRAFTERQAQVALAIAQEVAVAIENARLYERSRETAAQEERTRLARELHDSVTQMLFSSSVIAEVLPRLWERDPEAGRQSLEELHLLNIGAAAEMRSLLLELHPTALADATLDELLRQLSEGITARTRIPITVTLDGDQSVPADIQVVLYRIAQEALTNAAKHAQARTIRVVLQTRADGTKLTISDDGRGFDPGTVRPGHFGLKTMRERAEEIGASLTITSRLGMGTEVDVRWIE